ncbi:MAG: hypothetical protein ACYDC3_03570 [Candidatus Binataceae bacterium]
MLSSLKAISRPLVLEPALPVARFRGRTVTNGESITSVGDDALGFWCHKLGHMLDKPRPSGKVAPACARRGS